MKTQVQEKHGINRRALPRKPLMVLEVKGTRFDKIFVAYAENLGLGGLRLSSREGTVPCEGRTPSHPLTIGDRFPVEFVLPDQITKINCTCEVVWRYDSGSHSEGIGVRFLDLSQNLKKAISTWIEEDEKDKKNIK